MTLRIGVLTFHRCINYGSYWQARCLVEGLRARGHDAVLLDHQSRRINLAEWRCALRPDPQDGANPYQAEYVAKARRFFTAFDALPLSPPFPMEAPEQGASYDIVLVGSDEVWNLRHPWYGGVGLFYGEGVPTARLASYAASFGNQAASNSLDPYWSARLTQFDAISVRDANSQRLVADATGRLPSLVLDPCLQFPDRIPKDHFGAGQEDYAVVYGHGFPDWFQRSVRQWADRKGLSLISIGYDNPWADEQHINAGPLEFAALMAGASGIATNFFHGCVFSLLNGKPFVTAPSDYRFNKVNDLIALLGAETHMVSEATEQRQYDYILERGLASHIDDRIAALRVQSNAYLDYVLQ
jgi:hypothetical protein